jgi:HAD superfamily phosphoserine phosphatase-like hydrolase
MKYKDYSADVWNRINTTLDQVLKEDSAPIAAFDADGTLWDIDLGETFFHYQIDNKLVSLPKDAWNHYETMKADDPKKAYLWLAQICKGQTLEQVHAWAREGVSDAAPIPVFMEQKRLIDLFLKKGVRIFVVTASVKWAVEPGAEMLGLKKEDVIGIETHVDSGVISDRQKGLITYREGKVSALLEHTKGKRPFFASGNTMGDYDLLQSATHLSLAVSAASRDDRLFKTEHELQEKAFAHKWLSHRFI